MSNRNAFPTEYYTNGLRALSGGLTKRELFAALVMGGMATKDAFKGSYEEAQLAIEAAQNLVEALEA